MTDREKIRELIREIAFLEDRVLRMEKEQHAVGIALRDEGYIVEVTVVADPFSTDRCVTAKMIKDKA